MQTREELEKAILNLPIKDQFHIADTLEAHFLSDPNHAAAWTTAIDNRLKAYDEGTVEGMDSMQMLEDLKREFTH